MTDKPIKTQAVGLLYTLAYNPGDIRDYWRNTPIWSQFFNIDQPDSETGQAISEFTGLGRRAASSETTDETLWLQAVNIVKTEFINALFAPPAFQADFKQKIASTTPLAFLIGAILYNEKDRRSFITHPDSFITEHLRPATGEPTSLQQELQTVFIKVGQMIGEFCQQHQIKDVTNLSVLDNAGPLKANIEMAFNERALTAMACEYREEQEHIW